MAPSLLDVMVMFVNRYHDEDNGMITTSDWDFAEGTRRGRVQLKWWKAKQTVLIKEIYLTPNGLQPKYRVDASARALLQEARMQTAVKSVVIERACEGIIDMFIELGWMYNVDKGDLSLSV
jgi:hypothetical protein